MHKPETNQSTSKAMVISEILLLVSLCAAAWLAYTAIEAQALFESL